MKKPSVVVICSAMALGSCAAGTPPASGTLSEMRELPPFSSVALNGVGEVRIRKGPQAVRVTIDQGLADRFVTEVKGGKLTMGLKCGFGALRALRNMKTCVVEISMPRIDRVELDGAGEISVEELECKKLGVSVTGAGKLGLTGSVSELDVACTGGCTLDARGCVAREARIAMTGSSRVEARVEDSLGAKITGAGTLLYWGEPTVTQAISGTGSVRKAKD